MRRFLRFLMADAAPSGAAAPAPAPAPGSGPATALAAQQTPAEIDLLNYEPPAPDSLDLEEGGTPPPAPEPKPKVETPPAKPPGEKPPAPKPEEKPALPENAPASKLRERLKELETEKATAVADLERRLAAATSDRTVADLTAKLQAAEKLHAEVETKRAEVERQLLMHNPMVSQEVKKLTDDFNADWNRTVEDIPALATTYGALQQEFNALPRNSPDYPELLKAFRSKLKDGFDDDSGAVLDMLRKGYAFGQKHRELSAKIQNDATTIDFEGRRNAWKERQEDFEKSYAKTFEPPPDAETADPLNARLFMRNFEAGLPEGEAGKVDHNIKLFLGRVFNGAQPRRREDFPELDDAAAKAEIARIDSETARDQKTARELLPVAMKFLMYARPIIRELASAREERAKEKQAAPPDPTKKPGERQITSDEMPSPEDIANGLGQ